MIDMIDPAEKMVLGIPVDEKERMGIPFIPHKNSREVCCSQCQRKCLIGPQQALLADKFDWIKVWCPWCLLDHYGPDASKLNIIRLTNKKEGE